MEQTPSPGRGPSLPVTRRNHKARVPQTLEEKILAVSSQVRVATFSLPSANQVDSPFVQAPAEIRNKIYELCVFKGNRFHLYELSRGIKGSKCEDHTLLQPCVGTAPCHLLVGQINKIFPERYRVIPQCPHSCKCAPTKLLTLVRTCQIVYNETFSTMYRSNMFVISKYVFASILDNKHLKKQQTLSAALARIQCLQLDLGQTNYGSDSMMQSKHATLRIVKEHFTELRELCLTFTTLLLGWEWDFIDDESIRLIGRFRGLTAFKLVVTDGWNFGQETCRRKIEEFARAVPHIEDIFKKFVKLKDLDDTTGLDELEKKMARNDSKFAIRMKKKVKARLAEE